MTRQEGGAESDRREAGSGSDVVPEPSRRVEGSLALFVHEAAGGLRVLTGGGCTVEGVYIDIFGSVRPGGVWHGIRYEDLLPGRYDIIGETVVRDDGRVLSSD